MQQQPAAATLPQEPPDRGNSTGDAPPKQVAMAMERLSRAARLIADIRIGADHLLEALFMASESPHNSNKIIQLILKEESSMLQHFQDLRDLGNLIFALLGFGLLFLFQKFVPFLPNSLQMHPVMKHDKLLVELIKPFYAK